jgi:hypothetical protein
VAAAVDWAPLYIDSRAGLWLIGKMCFFFFVFGWVKATVPRYRYDQLMRLGWKIFLPLSILFVALVSGWLMLTRYGRQRCMKHWIAVGIAQETTVCLSFGTDNRISVARRLGDLLPSSMRHQGGSGRALLLELTSFNVGITPHVAWELIMRDMASASAITSAECQKVML